MKKRIIMATAILCVAVAMMIIVHKYQLNKYRRANVGDKIIFGKYEQDNDTSNGKEDLEWIVLAKEDDRILLISDKIIDCKPYNSEYKSVTWGNCTLGEWLNNDFIKETFSSKETNMIENTTHSDVDVTDKVFLLSVEEVRRYFVRVDIKCETTKYALDQGVYEDHWWLRSLGEVSDYPTYVYNNGWDFTYGRLVNLNYLGVRPALWISLK